MTINTCDVLLSRERFFALLHALDSENIPRRIQLTDFEPVAVSVGKFVFWLLNEESVPVYFPQ